MKLSGEQLDLIVRVADRFQTKGEMVHAIENHSGIINRTYILTYKEGKTKRMYTLQRMNTYVFKNPHEVMDNIQRVTAHLTEKLKARYPSDYRRRTLRVVPTKNDENFIRDHKDGCWRMFTYIDHASAYNRVRGTSDFYRSGLAFGEFQGLLADFPATTLHETIPDFHNTPVRLEALFRSAEEDIQQRRGAVREELRFFRQREEAAGKIASLIASGEIPLRVTHNDTKFNNVLIDDYTGDALCVIDLDTVMPGTALFDFGDAVRYGASTAAEDEADVTKIDLDLDLFRAFSTGFIRSTKGLLTENELKLLALGAYTITVELAARFLKDYLDGDLYFKTAYRGQNLVRARAQIALARKMEEKMPQMEEILSELLDVSEGCSYI